MTALLRFILAPLVSLVVKEVIDELRKQARKRGQRHLDELVAERQAALAADAIERERRAAGARIVQRRGGQSVWPTPVPIEGAETPEPPERVAGPHPWEDD